MMKDIFATYIEIKKVRNLENLTINLSKTERKHLIITGKNGSGKTTLLENLNHLFIDGAVASYTNSKRREDVILLSNDTNKRYGNTSVTFSYSLKEFRENNLVVMFKARRNTELNIPKGINQVTLKQNIQTNERINKDFIQYIVNLKAERSFARDDNDLKVVQRIDLWFENFENQLKLLFDNPCLKLIFDRKSYNFFIKINDNEPFSFNQLSDGYAAVIAIITELILRMEAINSKTYDVQGLVLIDEIETHLHVALQKKIMPFLCAFFPKIQFIVTTHSPFVLSSISNAVICDLETKEVINDLSGYSYDALVESYFDTDKYSAEIKEKIHRFEQLSEKETLEEAVRTAAEWSKEDDVVLFSPACSSFELYDDYRQRGDHFKSIVENL